MKISVPQDDTPVKRRLIMLACGSLLTAMLIYAVSYFHVQVGCTILSIWGSPPPYCALFQTILPFAAATLPAYLLARFCLNNGLVTGLIVGAAGIGLEGAFEQLLHTRFLFGSELFHSLLWNTTQFILPAALAGGAGELIRIRRTAANAVQ